MKISIITVCFNSSKTIKKTFESIENQSYDNIEYIVIDGGSTDSTLNIIKDYKEIIDNYISEPDDGLYDAMNKGISISSGEYIMFLNSDDVLKNIYTIQNLMHEIDKYSLNVVYGDISFFKADTNKIVRLWKSSKFKKQNISKGWHPPHPGFTVSKEIFNEVGVFNSKLKIVADYDFMLRCFNYEHLKIKYINDVIVNMRIGGASTTYKGVFVSFFELIHVLNKNNYSNLQITKMILYRYIIKTSQFFLK
jgi:glycosyltransferase